MEQCLQIARLLFCIYSSSKWVRSRTLIHTKRSCLTMKKRKNWLPMPLQRKLLEKAAGKSKSTGASQKKTLCTDGWVISKEYMGGGLLSPTCLLRISTSYVLQKQNYLYCVAYLLKDSLFFVKYMDIALNSQSTQFLLLRHFFSASFVEVTVVSLQISRFQPVKSKDTR